MYMGKIIPPFMDDLILIEIYKFLCSINTIGYSKYFILNKHYLLHL
jgi:hypothetical protein